MHAQEVSTQRGLIGRHVRAEATVDDVLEVLVLLHHVQHALRVAEEHSVAPLALEAQLFF